MLALKLKSTQLQTRKNMGMAKLAEIKIKLEPLLLLFFGVSNTTELILCKLKT